MPKPPSPETALRAARREGDRRAADGARTPSLDADLERLFAAHRDRVFRLCLRYTGDHARAEELVQDTLATAWRRLPTFHGGAAFGTWIYGIATNVCRNAVRKKADLLSDDGVLDDADPGASVLRELQRAERAAVVTRAAARVLGPREQEAVYLRYVEGLPIARIDALLALGGSGARGMLQTCRRRLRKAVVEELAALGHGASLLRSES